tara:strand:- start:374 stop:703 length:330 start_codon:yes stop_codon:yes gene_type:complete
MALVDNELLESQILWICGAAERLVGLGLLSSTPIVVNPDAIDTYLSVDEYRDYLFDDNNEMIHILRIIYQRFNEEVDEEQFRMLANMLIEYKEDRAGIVRFALEECAVG